jgi:hypothetical protein
MWSFQWREKTVTEERSSSNRVSEIKDAVLLKNERALGPMRLPESRPDDFIAHFNRTYEGLGMTLSPNEPDQIKEIPGSLRATGDQN